MPALVPIALFGYIPLILVLFSTLPPRRAVLAAFIFAWLFLPFGGYSIPGIPDYTKQSATSLGILLGTLLFRTDWLVAVRPRWFDLPIAVWTLCPIASSLSNGYGIYDGLSASFNSSVSWGLPYLIGRVYFSRLEDLFEVAYAIVIGGLIYIPFCLWEMKMSPQLHLNVYGVDPSGWGEVSYGGYRPKVFMSTGLELAMWMGATVVSGFWLWRSRAVRQIGGYPFGWFMGVLSITALLCRVTGGWLIMAMGVSLWPLMKFSRPRLLPVILLLVVPVSYIGVRALDLWSGREAVRLVATVFNERRAQSLEFRMQNEDILVRKALQSPVFGWAGWGRARVYDETGKDISTTDGLWIIAMGTYGLVGLSAFYATLLLPIILLTKRYPADAWLTPELAPACVLAILANLYAIDCIANGMVNPIYSLAVGAVTGVIGTIDRQNVSIESGSAGSLESHPDDPDGCGASDPREAAAIRLGARGRSLRDRGRTPEAEEAWLASMQLWAALVADYPDVLGYRKCWLDSLNDSAWALISPTGAGQHQVARAIQFAEQAVGLDPGSATYWNTLGIAYCRAGDWSAASNALKRSVEIGGGTSFDYFFLAIAYWRQGDGAEARAWYSRGCDWMAENDPEHASLRRFRAEAAGLLDPRPLRV
jgi:tetratricopeptide (TPR) repeat protein